MPNDALPPSTTTSELRFGTFRLLTEERRLVRDGVNVALGQRAFDVLQALVDGRGRLVTKEALLASVWHGLIVEESNVHVQVSHLRKVIGTDTIATVPGQGYRFAIPIRDATVPERVAPVSRGLSILVLPFVETGTSPDETWFADAITDEVIMQVSKIRGASVIATPTALTLKGDSVDWVDTARELGVRYVLHGRIERDQTAVEVTARLSEVASQTVLWSDRFEVRRSAVRQIRHELVARLAAALDLELLHAEARRIRTVSDGSQAVQDLVMQGRTIGGSNWSRDHFTQAISLFDRALAIEPDHAEALAHRSLLSALRPCVWPGPEIADQVSRAEADALRALEIDSLEPVAHHALALVRQQQYRLDESLAAIETAIDLNPNQPSFFAHRGELLKYRVDTDGARDAYMRVMALSPRGPYRWLMYAGLGFVEVVAGDAAAAVRWLERSIALQPYWLARMFLVAAYARLGGGERMRVLIRESVDGAAERAQYNAWNRVTDQPAFLARMRSNLFEPLHAVGAFPDLAIADAWIARQRRRGAPPTADV